LVGGASKETSHEAHFPAILATALIVAPTAALAQNNMGYSGTTSNPATANSKDETTSVPKAARKHMASSKKKHHSRYMKSNAQPGPGNSSNPAAAATHEDVTPKSR
jgi:hypothetical protein